MMYYLLPILGIMLIVGLVVYMNMQNNAGRSSSHPLARNRDRRNLHNDAQGYQSYGKLEKDKSAADDESRRHPFKGTGTQTTPSVFLDGGVYYLVCQFPNDQKLTVDLVTEDDDTRKTITSAAGYSTVSFSVKNARKYAFHVQSDAADVQWAIMVKPL